MVCAARAHSIRRLWVLFELYAVASKVLKTLPLKYSFYSTGNYARVNRNKKTFDYVFLQIVCKSCKIIFEIVFVKYLDFENVLQILEKLQQPFKMG